VENKKKCKNVENKKVGKGGGAREGGKTCPREKGEEEAKETY
jgi:hypothetical protein